MNDTSDLIAMFRQRAGRLLPIILMVLFLLGGVVVGVLLILPNWHSYDDLNNQQLTVEAAVQTASQPAEDMSGLLESRIATANAHRNEVAGVFLSSEQVDEILNRLFAYAEESDVEIVDMQSQTPTAEPDSDVYEVSTYQLQVIGPVDYLVNFATRIQEAAAPSVAITNFKIEQQPNTNYHTLTIALQLYASTYSNGDALASLPARATPTRIPLTPTPTIPPQITPTATPSLVSTIPPTEVNAAGDGIYNEDDPALVLVAGTWERITSSKAYAGGYYYSGDENAELLFVFKGTSVGVQYVAFRNFSIFEIYVDDVLWGTVDGYAPESVFGPVVKIENLADGVHSLRIRNTTQQNPASQGYVVAVDAVRVPAQNTEGLATPTPTP